MKTAYLHANLLDGTEKMSLQSDVTVVVEKGKIVEITKGWPKWTIPVDLHGKFVIPGLINLHVHLPAGGKPSKKPVDNKPLVKLIKSNPLTRFVGLKLCHSYAMTAAMSGTTTVRAVGGIADFDTKLRDKINSGKWGGPRILAANEAIAVPEGHMVGTVAVEAHSPDEAVRLVIARIAEGADLIKLMITGGVLDAKVKGEPGVLKMPLEYVKAACDEAHSHGFKVAAHVESAEGVRVAVEGGVDTIEHGAPISEETAVKMQQQGTAMICTISPALPYARIPREITGSSELAAYNSEVVLKGVIEGAKTCLASHIPVGLGTDTGCPFTTHYDMWRELAYYTKLVGVTPEFALYSATLGNAKIAGVDNVCGSIEVGKSADFVVTDRNPLDDFSTLRKPYMVVVRGEACKKPNVKKYPLVEQELDKVMAAL